MTNAPIDSVDRLPSLSMYGHVKALLFRESLPSTVGR